MNLLFAIVTLRVIDMVVIVVWCVCVGSILTLAWVQRTLR